jgi:hypothetical protein
MLRRSVCLVLACSLAGCSFFMTKAPATDPGTRPVPCEQSMVPPYADATGAAALAILGIVSIPLKSSDTSTTTFVIADLALFSVAAVFAYSAYTGHKSVKRCRALNELPATQNTRGGGVLD